MSLATQTTQMTSMIRLLENPNFLVTELGTASECSGIDVIAQCVHNLIEMAKVDFVATKMNQAKFDGFLLTIQKKVEQI